ncbi:spore coat CotO family protein [Bacillus clarus]|uniref:Spore coat CotO family protein n=1 Tax=Bacillus clarus TaxID=2338372 RepID=A0A090YMB8_9BACI|nr:spore coat CotO family protein [Bacillus clarus]
MENKNKSSTVGKPLLYIAQVSSNLVRPKMQRILITKIENGDRQERSNSDQNVINQVEEVETEQEFQENEEQHQEQQEHYQQQVEQVTTVPNNKSFKDMSNEEKIHFLLNRPHYIPKVRCRIKTNTVSYVGSIISYRDGVVFIMPPNSMRDIKLSIEDIKSIDMAGL